jgi:hypothetical protein
MGEIGPKSRLDYQYGDRVEKRRGRTRDYLGYLTGAMNDAARWFMFTQRKEPGTLAHTEADRISTESFINWGTRVIGSVVIGIGLLAAYRLRILRLDAILDPARKAANRRKLEATLDKAPVVGRLVEPAITKAEVTNFVIFRERGVDKFVENMGLLSHSINTRTLKTVDWQDVSSWGEPEDSNLAGYVHYYSRFMDSLMTKEGRDRLKEGINEQGGRHQEEFTQALDKFEKYLSDEGLGQDVTLENIQQFCVNVKGLKAPEKGCQILIDVKKAWDKQDFTEESTNGLQKRINEYNPEELEISSQAEPEAVTEARVAGREAARLFEEGQMKEVIDRDVVVELARDWSGKLPPQYWGVKELKALAREVLPDPWLPQPPKAALGPQLILGCVFGLLLIRDQKLRLWARGTWDRIRSEREIEEIREMSQSGEPR